jgi:branched-chain amino acid transport system permease protein
MTLALEQILNGIQFGVMLFLLAAGLTLVFGVMRIINLAHGSFYMIGAYGAALAGERTGSFAIAALAGLVAAANAGLIVEYVVIRRLYARDHVQQVLATFGIILLFNEGATILFGRQPLYLPMPSSILSGAVQIIPGVPYPAYRLMIIAAGLLVAIGLSLFINRTRMGMLVRAGSTHREMVRALGVNVGLLYTLVFGLGALLAGLGGLLAAPLFGVQVGMGEQILILTFVVVVIGGVGSIRGAFAGAMLVGVTDTLLHAFLPTLLHRVMAVSQADALGAGLSSMGIYLVMALVLLIRPQGLVRAPG